MTQSSARYTIENLEFARSRADRDARSGAKDRATIPILRDIVAGIRRPRSFRALLMPCLHGPELRMLIDAGVRRRHVWAIERVESIWRALRDTRRVRVTPWPMDAWQAIDHVQACVRRFDLIYLDFFSQPTWRNVDLLAKVLGLGSGGMVARGGTLMLNFGRGHTTADARELGIMLRGGGVREWSEGPECLVRIACDMVGHAQPGDVRRVEYTEPSLMPRVGSRGVTFTTTAIRF